MKHSNSLLQDDEVEITLHRANSKLSRKETLKKEHTLVNKLHTYMF